MGLFDVLFDVVDLVLEDLVAFAEALHQFRDLRAAEQQQHDKRDDDDLSHADK